MEVDFDKEIDALLRKARRDGPVYVGDVAAPHLEADEIAAFAENALPGNARALYMKHLADCDRCRKVLSNVLVMNAGEAPALAAAAAAPSAITIAERDLPWYRKLFLFPNLAYVMGSLVLVFGGFLAFTLVQNSRLNDGAMVSQAPESRGEESGPSFQFEPPYDSANSTANTSANMSNSMSAANTNTAPLAMPTPALGDSAPVSRENNFVLDGAATGSAPTAAPPPPPLPRKNKLRERMQNRMTRRLKRSRKRISRRNRLRTTHRSSNTRFRPRAARCGTTSRSITANSRISTAVVLPPPRQKTAMRKAHDASSAAEPLNANRMSGTT